MDEPVHDGGPGQAEPKEATDSSPAADALRREPFADAIPTVEPERRPPAEVEIVLAPGGDDIAAPEREFAVDEPVTAVPPVAEAICPTPEPWASPARDATDVRGEVHSALVGELSAQAPEEASEGAAADVAVPAESDTDIFTPAPGDVPASIVLDGLAHELPRPDEPLPVVMEAPAAEPAQEQSQPIAAEEIWSGPEAGEPREQTPQVEPVHPHVEPRSAVGISLEPLAPLPVRRAAVSELAAAPAQIAVAAASGLAPSWPPSAPPVALPSAKRLGGAIPYLRLALRVLTVLLLGYAGVVLLLVVAYRWIDPPASTLMLAQRLGGTPIEQRWVPLGRISPNLVQAVMLSEDGAFCRHHGVDWRALQEAIDSSRDGNVRGGSTITMQVVKNLFLWSSRSYIRKAIEIPLAYVVELFWPKRRILEIYLNIAEWGDGVFGAEAAARHHFGKRASQLTPEQAALLAVSLPNPIEREAGFAGPLTRRLAANLLVRMRAVRSATTCVGVHKAVF